MKTLCLVSSALLLATSSVATAQKSGGQASLTLRDCNVELCHKNDTEWTLTKTGPDALAASGETVMWVVEATRGATSPNMLLVNGFIRIQNTGSANATIGNIVVNLQKRVGTNWVSAAADCADATSNDAATGSNIVASASQENPTINASLGAANYTVTGARGRFVETAGSGTLSFTDANSNTAFSLVPEISLPAGQEIALLYVATFDNSVMGIPAGALVRSEVIVSFGNAGARGGSGASASNIDVNGDGGIDSTAGDGLPLGMTGSDDGDERNVRSVPCRDTNAVPPLEACNDAVTLTDVDPGDLTSTGSASFSGYATDIGGGSGVEVITTSVTRFVSVVVDGGLTGGTVTNCAHLTGDSDSVIVNGPLVNNDNGTPDDPTDDFQEPAFSFTFPCCVGVDLDACDSVDVGAESGCTGPYDDGCFCSYTQGGWGSRPNGNNPGSKLANNFAAVYPAGVEVGIAGAGGNSMRFSSAAAIESYLPAGGPSGALTADLVNPTSTSSGVFGGQVLALRLNVDFSAAGVTMGSAGEALGTLTLCNTGGILDGMTVAQVLAVAETALGGGGLPAGYTFGSLNNLITALNESFDNCRTTPFANVNLCH